MKRLLNTENTLVAVRGEAVVGGGQRGELADRAGGRGGQKTRTGVHGVNLALFSEGAEAASGNTGTTRKQTIHVQPPLEPPTPLGGLASLSSNVTKFGHR